MKKRYVVVGLGNRGPSMFVKPLVRQYSDVAELVGICDINPHRLELVRSELDNTVQGSPALRRCSMRCGATSSSSLRPVVLTTS